ncbi:terminase gpA endonuclease subunit [Gimesia fumaroli]|uniref:Phage terminase large subunit (GpA) n=1 Tax=Gimesia fumaroli TaxID=2527976 RepID=A0A518ICL6_9PLAN|nr:terminase gpA endonuclease subunit [Gimesia fumaroli]QDV50842.1 Phage terminase large subunit (GpA) [Gimesia fumaroli]
MIAPTTIKNRIKPLWAPPKKVYAEDWIPANVKTPKGSEYEGYCNYDLAPHTREVFRAFDDESIREIYLIWATRSAKTTTMTGLMMHAAVNRPKPMAFGSCDEPSTNRTYDEMIYPMLENCTATAGMIPPKGKRPADMVVFDRCRCRKAFGGSPATVAGYPACFLFGNEWDKWPRRKSSEAQAANSFTQRAKGYPYESKAIFESTPGEISTSRIWKLRNAKRTQRREYYVPCPHCLHHQTLRREQLQWEGKGDPEADQILAAETAVYLCEDCGRAILNEDRAEMMRAGKWVAEGQTIDRRGRIHGKPTVDSAYVCFGPFSTLYSLLISGWGQYVAELLGCGDDPDKLRDFQNSTDALPYDPAPEEVDPHELARILRSDEDHIAICPIWSRFITRAVDVQSKAAGYEFPWQVCAWGEGGRGGTVTKGTAYGFHELSGVLNRRDFPHADGGPNLYVPFDVIDSGDGNSTDDVYAFCHNRPFCFPLKGSSTSFPKNYALSEISNDLRSQKQTESKERRLLNGEVLLILVNTMRSQFWLQRILDGRIKADAINRFSIPAELADDEAFLEELLNEYQDIDFGPDGFFTRGWKRRTRNPNDQRDLIRYNWAAAQIITNNGQEWYLLPDRPNVTEEVRTPRRKRKRKVSHYQGGGRQCPGNR